MNLVSYEYYYEVLKNGREAFVLLSCENEVYPMGNHFRVQLFFKSSETNEKIQTFLCTHLKKIYRLATNCLLSLNGRVSIRKNQDQHFVVKCNQNHKVYQKVLSQEELDCLKEGKTSAIFMSKKLVNCEMINMSLGLYTFKVARSIRKIYLALSEKKEESFLFQQLFFSKAQFEKKLIKFFENDQQFSVVKDEVEKLYLFLKERIKEKQIVLWKSVLEQREVIKLWLKSHVINQTNIPHAFVEILNWENKYIKNNFIKTQNFFNKTILNIVNLHPNTQVYEIHLLIQILLNKRSQYQSFQLEVKKYTSN